MPLVRWSFNKTVHSMLRLVGVILGVGRCLVLAHLFSSRKQWWLSGHQFSLLQVNSSLKFISKNIWEICGVTISTNIWSALSCLTAWCFPRTVRGLFNLGEPLTLTLTFFGLMSKRFFVFAMIGWTNVTWLRHPMKRNRAGRSGGRQHGRKLNIVHLHILHTL